MTATPSADVAFRAIFDAHNAAIRAFCARRLPTDDANDAASDVFLTAWRRIDDLPPGGETLLWLYGVARNVVRNHQRTARRWNRLSARTSSLAGIPEDGPEVQVVRTDEHAQVIAAMSSLPDHDRDVLELKLWEGLTNDEVADVLGITKRGVEGRYTRALKKVSKQLESGVRTAQGSPFSVEKGGVSA